MIGREPVRLDYGSTMPQSRRARSGGDGRLLADRSPAQRVLVRPVRGEVLASRKRREELPPNLSSNWQRAGKVRGVAS